MAWPEAVTWGALLILLYMYLGHPALLLLLLRLRRPPPLAAHSILPSVTMVVAAWNEEDVIAQKVANTLALDYPTTHLDLIVVSDGSTDRTDVIVEEYARQTPRVRLLRTAGRVGKSLALNQAVPSASGEIVVLTDANAIFAPDAITHLVAPFGDPRVGAVSGQLHYEHTGREGTGEGVYWRYEQLVKQAESGLRTLLGANGSIYAIRRELFRPLHARDVNDFRVPYEILLDGYSVVLDPEARSFEPAAEGLHAEYRRKVRIMSRAIPMMLSLTLATLRRRRLFLLWQLVSHKLLREMQGLFFLALYVGSLWGVAKGDAALTTLFVAQSFGYLLAAVGGLIPAPRRPKLLRLAAHVGMIVLASLAALGQWMTGGVRATWEPVRPGAGQD